MDGRAGGLVPGHEQQPSRPEQLHLDLRLDGLSLRRHLFSDVFQQRKIASPAVFWVCSIIGAISSFFGMWTVFTNPFSTQLLSKSDWWHTVAAVAVLSLAVVPVLYVIGTRRAREAPLPPEAEVAAGQSV
jgi:hypothetical protein